MLSSDLKIEYEKLIDEYEKKGLIEMEKEIESEPEKDEKIQEANPKDEKAKNTMKNFMEASKKFQYPDAKQTGKFLKTLTNSILNETVMQGIQSKLVESRTDSVKNIRSIISEDNPSEEILNKGKGEQEESGYDISEEKKESSFITPDQQNALEENTTLSLNSKKELSTYQNLGPKMKYIRCILFKNKDHIFTTTSYKFN